MAVDLGDLVEPFRLALSAPGQDALSADSEEAIIGRLQNAFWAAVLEGVVKNYVVDDDGLVTPVSPLTTDMPRDVQQVIVLYAAWQAVLMQALSTKALFKAVAGPVSFETQQSATVLREVATQIRNQLNLIINRLGDLNSVNVGVLDAVIERSYSMAFGEQWWVR